MKTNNIIKKIQRYLSLVLLLTTTNCVTIDDELIAFFMMVENQSDTAVKVYTHIVSEVPPTDSTMIMPGERKAICYYEEFGYAGFSCRVGRIKYVFANGKGYDCIKGMSLGNESSDCFFLGKDPFWPNRLPNRGNGTLFVITQEDFEMARDL